MSRFRHSQFAAWFPFALAILGSRATPGRAECWAPHRAARTLTSFEGVLSHRVPGARSHHLRPAYRAWRVPEWRPPSADAPLHIGATLARSSRSHVKAWRSLHEEDLCTSGRPAPV